MTDEWWYIERQRMTASRYFGENNSFNLEEHLLNWEQKQATKKKY